MIELDREGSMVVATSAELTLRVSGPAEMGEMSLWRLERFLRLKSEHEKELNLQGKRLLDRMVFSAFCSLSEAIGREEAVRVLKREMGVVPEHLKANQIQEELPEEDPQEEVWA